MILHGPLEIEIFTFFHTCSAGTDDAGRLFFSYFCFTPFSLTFILVLYHPLASITEVVSSVLTDLAAEPFLFRNPLTCIELGFLQASELQLVIL